jgi:hypothetical protein
MNDIRRFPRADNFLGYFRLMKRGRELGGKRLCTGGKKFGNSHLKWTSARQHCC